ncbi:MAG TPA: SRPBCC domain-containing protein [candidate division Zixibacteria bacterium]|nr:SRPBCC domain-containing protein [candidate division Zixibacteria bacterium]
MDAVPVDEARPVDESPPDDRPADDSPAVERTSDRELVVTRTVKGPARLVFEAWTDAELLRRWWVPESFPITLLSCETDPRVGGRYRLVFSYEGSTMEFFGQYLEVTPPTRLAWTNEEDDGEPITTVTFEETDGGTRVTVHELYPSKEALDAAIANGSTGISAMPESLGQLEELLATLDAA